MDILQLAVDQLEVGAMAMLVVFFRVGAAVSFLPGFGERSIPTRVKLAMAVALTMIVAPAVDNVPSPQRALDLARLLATETLIGLALGILVRLSIFVLQIAGTIAAQSTSLSQVFGATGPEPLPAIGHVLVLGGLALAAVIDAHVMVIISLVRTYDLFPPGTILPPADLAMHAVQRIGEAFSLGFTLAAPFVVAAFIYNLALGAINRAMPQLMVAFVGAPAITGAGLALLAISAPTLLELWAQSLTRTLAQPFGVP